MTLHASTAAHASADLFDASENSRAEDIGSSTDLVEPSLIRDICDARDRALAKMRDASETLTKGYALASEASEIAAGAHMGIGFYLEDRRENERYKHLFGDDFDAAQSLEVYRKHLDACVWISLLNRVGIERIMDRTAKDDLMRSLLNEVPEISFDNVAATIEQLFADADLIFKRGLAKAFSDLDRRFRSHDGFKIGSRIILTHVFDDSGFWNYHGHHRETFIDIERVFAVLDAVPPNPGALIKAIDESRGRGFDPRQSEAITPYFKIRGFMNGNAHVWFMRDDLVAKANNVLAEYYGDVVADAAPKDATAEDIRHRSGLPAKDLQFYPTPEGVVDRLMDLAHLHEGVTVLEPSAGTGAIVKAAAERGASVRAVEIHGARAAAISALNMQNVDVNCANFLQMPVDVSFDLVLMNPPFYGTHWIDHVCHAFAFLKPGGRLLTILPATAELGESARHKAFHKWAKDNAASWAAPVFRDLPPESFASVGARINTVILELRKPRQQAEAAS
ncbi:MAG: DUF4942 domain-containing protein [Pseudomonadota bacterium]